MLREPCAESDREPGREAGSGVRARGWERGGKAEARRGGEGRGACLPLRVRGRVRGWGRGQAEAGAFRGASTPDLLPLFPPGPLSAIFPILCFTTFLSS